MKTRNKVLIGGAVLVIAYFFLGRNKKKKNTASAPLIEPTITDKLTNLDLPSGMDLPNLTASTDVPTEKAIQESINVVPTPALLEKKPFQTEIALSDSLILPIDKSALIAEQERQAELARQAEQERQAELARLAEEARQAELARILQQERLAEEARLADQARVLALQLAEKQAEEARQAELARQLEQARLIELERVLALERAKQAEIAKLEEEARLAEEARQAQLAIQAERERLFRISLPSTQPAISPVGGGSIEKVLFLAEDSGRFAGGGGEFLQEVYQ